MLRSNTSGSDLNLARSSAEEIGNRFRGALFQLGDRRKNAMNTDAERRTKWNEVESSRVESSQVKWRSLRRSQPGPGNASY